jgi:hypothetical protein
MSKRRSILLLCDDRRDHAGNVLQHIAALSESSRHAVYRFNPVDHPVASAALDPDEFDVVVIHYTIMVTSSRYLSPDLAAKIARFRGLKVQLIQDEYRAVDTVTAAMRRLGIDVLYTCVPSPEREEMYADRLPGVTLVTTLPGFVPDELAGRNVPTLGDRPIDVGYRGRDVPYWLGRLGREKTEIGPGFLSRAAESGLRCNISSREEDRIYGERWNRFLQTCRATLGTESGASVVDFDSSIQQRVDAYLVRHPDADFEEVEREILCPYEGVLTIHVASPRLFEAAALRTAMVLFRGEYSGVVEPWTHYLPLDKDFSNVDEVMEALRDIPRLEKMTDRAYADLVESARYSLRAFVSEFDDLIDDRSRAAAPASKPSFRRASKRRRLASWRGPSRPRTAIGTLAKPLAAAALIARDPAVRRLALAAGLAVPRLFPELLRLAALRKASGRSFHVSSTLEAEGRRLMFTSQTKPQEENIGDSWDPSACWPTEIVWDHSPVAATIPLVGASLLGVPVGHRGVPGGYGFDQLAGFARRSRRSREEPVAHAR